VAQREITAAGFLPSGARRLLLSGSVRGGREEERAVLAYMRRGSGGYAAREFRPSTDVTKSEVPSGGCGRAVDALPQAESVEGEDRADSPGPTTQRQWMSDPAEAYGWAEKRPDVAQEHVDVPFFPFSFLFPFTFSLFPFHFQFKIQIPL
jgi:hypothetical protein